jgi:hypothetical protein
VKTTTATNFRATMSGTPADAKGDRGAKSEFHDFI